MKGRMTYIPAEMLEEVEMMKLARQEGRSYEICYEDDSDSCYETCYDSCYDSKEENEKDERFSPHTPFPKEEKEKEERLSLYKEKEKKKF